MSNNDVEDIEDIHKNACLKNKDIYIDPKTGLSVFTKVFMEKRGYCCGNGCRHCPFNNKDPKKRWMKKRVCKETSK